VERDAHPVHDANGKDPAHRSEPGSGAVPTIPVVPGEASPSTLRVVLLTREYPPEVYGGAGVHVDYLSRELARLADVEVRCFGRPREATTGEHPRVRLDRSGAGPPGRRPGLSVRAFEPWDALPGDEPSGQAVKVMAVDLAMASGLEGDLVHSHTWYTNLAGHVAKLAHGLPHVATTHSLEPLRPWKAQQLGTGGYALSCFCERTGLEHADAVIAVSAAMRDDLLLAYPAIDPSCVDVVHNGIDASEYAPDGGTDVLLRHGIDPGRPSVAFVGRVTRQKGIAHLLEAAPTIDPRAQLVLCAGAPDTPEIAVEVGVKLAAARERHPGIVWIDQMLPRRDLVQVLSHATVFCCPSIYEPFGIVNLEAMACGAAVVATATGGIPEVVEDGVTGLLVPFEPGPSGDPVDPPAFAEELATRVNELVGDPERARAMGRAGRQRVLERFTWSAVAGRTLQLYRRVLERAGS
jgi:alpha-maltose-1-phosphate synthase